MGGNMKVWIVLATWFWWNAVVGPAWACPVEQHTLSWSCPVEQHTLSWSCTLMAAEQHTFNYQVVRFTTVNVTKSSYEEFIKAVRAQLASGQESHGIPVTREPSKVRDSERYVDLEGVANQSREKIKLGMGPFERAITTLRFSKIEQQSPIASSLIVVIQMVAEAARFTYIVYHVRKRIPEVEVFCPNHTMLRYEKKWKALSRGIQQSNQGGVFLKPVKLINQVDNTNHPAIKGLAICKSKSDRAATTNHQHFIDHDMFMIRPVVVDADVATNVDKEFNDNDDDDDDDDTFPYPDPTVCISGRNGLCVDVRDGRYNNGNPIQLWPCQETLEVNQLWTLREDGTIRSNSMCLTTNGSSPGTHVMIYDCAAAEKAATLWQLWENGAIKNPKSGLVLSTESGDNGTILTVETNINASRQGWFASNNTEPFVTFIIGFDDLCMQANGNAMWVVECEDQKWALYPDGTIRPQENQDRCLTSSHYNSQEIIIIISSCGPGSEDQRWVFTNAGTIWNMASGMVMEVKRSDPSLHQIILSGFTGNPNQKWLPLFSLLLL
ncbi:hypothetical protein MRB53_013249 [Persea americana]|uniref:Uncharacterized protein n=1 Tax=Persea americana TaxID=3435 RepID=A0ACC2K7F2_PERAE|nr:hypothetical protein MRB53_013249 [Persea americana]